MISAAFFIDYDIYTMPFISSLCTGMTVRSTVSLSFCPCYSRAGERSIGVKCLCQHLGIRPGLIRAIRQYTAGLQIYEYRQYVGLLLRSMQAHSYAVCRPTLRQYVGPLLGSMQAHSWAVLQTFSQAGYRPSLSQYTGPLLASINVHAFFQAVLALVRQFIQGLHSGSMQAHPRLYIANKKRYRAYDVGGSSRRCMWAAVALRLSGSKYRQSESEPADKYKIRMTEIYTSQ